MKKIILAFILLLCLTVLLASCEDPLPELGEGPGPSATNEAKTEEATTMPGGGIQAGEDTDEGWGALITPS